MMYKIFVTFFYLIIIHQIIRGQPNYCSITTSEYNWENNWKLTYKTSEYIDNSGRVYYRITNNYAQEYEKFPTTETYYTFDSKGNLVLKLSIWPGISKEKYIYDYNSGGLITNYYGEEKRFDDNGYNKKWNSESQYDENQRLIFELFKEWDFDKDLWVINYRKITDYSDNYLSSINLMELWRNEQWNPYVESHTIYDTQGRVLENIGEDLTNQHQTKTNYTFDETGNLLFYSLAYKNKEDNDYVIYEELTNEYNLTGKISHSLERYWDNKIQKWNFTHEQSRSYDAMGNEVETEHRSEIYDYEKDSFQVFNTLSQYNISYDSDNRVIEKILNNNGELMIKTVFEYNDNTHGSKLTVFPNPTRDKISVINQVPGYGVLQFIDLGGRIVLQDEGFYYSLIELDISTLPSGLYILKMYYIDINTTSSVRILKIND